MQYLFSNVHSEDYDIYETKITLLTTDADLDLVKAYNRVRWIGNLFASGSEIESALEIHLEMERKDILAQEMQDFLDLYDKNVKEQKHRQDIDEKNRPYNERIGEIRKEIEQKRLGLIEELALYKRFSKEQVTPDFILELKKQGYEPYDTRRGRQRFRRIDFDQVMINEFKPKFRQIQESYEEELKELHEKLLPY